MTDYLTPQEAESIHNDAKELYVILVSITKTTKNNSQYPK